MKTVTFISLFAASLLFISCSEETKHGDLKSDLEDTLDAIEGNGEQFNGKLDQLLTLEMASKCANESPKEAKVNYNKVLDRPEYHSLVYKWSSDRKRTMEISGTTIDVPESNIVSIGSVKATNLKSFNKIFYVPTEKELEAAKESMKKSQAKMVAEGKITQEQSDQASDLAGSFMKKSEVIKISGVGEAAAWTPRKQFSTLKVYAKGIQFDIDVSISIDQEENKRAAIKLAKEVVKNI